MCPANGIFETKKNPPEWAFRYEKLQLPVRLVHHEVKNQPLVRDFLVVHSSIMSAQSCSIALR